MNRSNSNKLKSLATISVVLLFAVLAYWNTDNYKRAALELQQDLTDQMTLASSVYRDSIVQDLFRFIEFKPSHDSMTIMNHFDLKADSLHDRIQTINGQSSTLEFTLRVDSRERDTHYHPGWDSISSNVESADTSIRIMYDQDNDRKIIVWDSDVKRIPKSVTIDPAPVKGVDWISGISMDTIVVFDSHEMGNFAGPMPRLYRKIDSIFSKKLIEVGIKIPHKLILFERSDDSFDLPSISIPLEYGNILDGGRPYAVFSKYRSYVLKKIMPSLVISVILLIVIGMSFLTILKSWLAQDRLTQVKNEFVSNMTHELKTPISTIGVAIEALENFGGLEDPIRRKEYLDISKHEINRLGILVDKVLKMSTLDVQEELALTSEVDMSVLMDDMLKSMKLHLDKHNAILHYESKGTDFLVLGDKIHLTNVLYNLLDNAIKYSDEEPKIDIEILSGESNVTIVISDEGIGVPVGYESKVFERFFRVPTDDRHNVKGYGLGLHYVKTIIDKHNGSVTFKNRTDVGSQLTITIPKSNG